MATLADELKNLRAIRGWTLRQVEEKTKGKVSNSYLYQLESGAVKEPSPKVLYEIAKAYDASYPGLMKVAGYVVPKDAIGGSVAFNALDLTEEEEQEVVRYIRFRRGEKQKRRL